MTLNKIFLIKASTVSRKLLRLSSCKLFSFIFGKYLSERCWKGRLLAYIERENSCANVPLFQTSMCDSLIFPHFDNFGEDNLLILPDRHPDSLIRRLFIWLGNYSSIVKPLPSMLDVSHSIPQHLHRLPMLPRPLLYLLHLEFELS
jgi:hypothetical protein